MFKMLKELAMIIILLCGFIAILAAWLMYENGFFDE
jgi:hypothetical protein